MCSNVFIFSLYIYIYVCVCVCVFHMYCKIENYRYIDNMISIFNDDVYSQEKFNE